MPETAREIEDLLAKARESDEAVAAQAAGAEYAGDPDPYKKHDDEADDTDEDAEPARELSRASGLVIVDKPSGWTSHDVVARLRRTLGTRKVGHAGTLDPMATGVLVLGFGRATRLLGHLMLADKAYAATMRLGVATSPTTPRARSSATDATEPRERRRCPGRGLPARSARSSRCRRRSRRSRSTASAPTPGCVRARTSSCPRVR